MALTKLEKNIKKINSRIVEQVKKYGLNKRMTLNYISDLYGLNPKYVQLKPRKVGVDASGNAIYVDIPQFVTTKNVPDSMKNVIRYFEQKKTPAKLLQETKRELKLANPQKSYSTAEVEDVLNDYIDAINNASSLINEYYKLLEAGESANDPDIQFFKTETTNVSKLEFLEHYKNLKEKAAELSYENLY